MNEVVKTSESIIVEAKRKAEICVLFYPPYYATELERPVSGECELLFTPSSIRRPAYFDGLLKALLVLNIDYDMADLSTTSSADLSKYKQVWAFCTDEMNAADQQTIVDYASEGGNIVLFPYLPDREMSNNLCTIIRGALKVSPSGKEIIDSPLIDIYEHKDIKCANPLIVYSPDNLTNAEIIARTLNGSICGFEKSLEKGSVIHLGTWIGFDTEGQKPVYETILKKSGAKLRQSSSGNENIAVRERFTSKNSAILFVGNYYNEDHVGKVSYTHPENGEQMSIPYVKNEMLWPSLYGVLSPLCLEIRKGIKILHCTSDILNISKTEGKVEMTLFGNRDLHGEIVFDGTNINEIKSAIIGSVVLKMQNDGKRIAFTYEHKHNQDFVLVISIV
jgi:beta-galactosidase